MFLQFYFGIILNKNLSLSLCMLCYVRDKMQGKVAWRSTLPAACTCTCIVSAPNSTKKLASSIKVKIYPIKINNISLPWSALHFQTFLFPSDRTKWENHSLQSDIYCVVRIGSGRSPFSSISDMTFIYYAQGVSFCARDPHATFEFVLRSWNSIWPSMISM